MSKTAIQPTSSAEFNDQFGFSAAVRSGNFVFVSGQVGTYPDGDVPDEPKAQFVEAFENLGAVLGEAGLTFDHIVDLTSYHVGLRTHIETFADIKRRYIAPPYPAWTAIGVSELVFPGLLAEIKAIAHST